MDCSPARPLCPRDSPGNSTEVGCHFLLQGIFLTQGSNPGLPHCKQVLYCLSHQGLLGVEWAEGRDVTEKGTQKGPEK